MKLMTRKMLLATLALVTCTISSLGAQATHVGAQATQGPPRLTTFRVDVVLTRMEGTKVLGTSPFSLLANSPGNGRATVRIGVDVPSGTVSNPTGSGRTETAFKTIGTQIDCSVLPYDEGRYSVDVSISDTAVFSADSSSNADRASFALAAASKELARVEELHRKGLVTQAQLGLAQRKVDQATIEDRAASRARGIATRADQMAFSTFSATNRLYLRDGQTQQMTVATDKTSGQTLKADVTLTVVK